MLVTDGEVILTGANFVAALCTPCLEQCFVVTQITRHGDHRAIEKQQAKKKTR